jgi:preprotein translocase subunit SecF
MKLLRLAPENTKFPFMRFRRVSYPFSAVLSIVSVLLFILRGMNFGIDFAGGTVIELRAKTGQVEVGALRALGENLKLGEIEVQAFGNATDATLRFGLQAGGDAAQQAAVERVRGAVAANYDLRRVEVVGPRVSNELVQSGTLGVVLSIIAVLSYLWFRFEWQFAVGAVIATMHDLLLTVGFFSLTQLEFNTTSIAAILTIVGYSLNETVVVLDRIREMMRKYKKMATAHMIDMSVNAVLPRTIMTATTVFLALLSLVVFGGQVIRSFSLAMIWGIFVATYSSVFICSPMLIYLGLRNEEADKAAQAKPAAPAKAEAASKAQALYEPEEATAKAAAKASTQGKSAANPQTNKPQINKPAQKRSKPKPA